MARRVTVPALPDGRFPPKEPRHAGTLIPPNPLPPSHP